MKVIIVDDELDAIALLKQYLTAYPKLEVIGQAMNGVDALLIIEDSKPDIVFLDIQMPGLNGFEVLDRLTYLPLIIFSTAYDQFALRAFDTNAIDYLLKPYGKKRFDAAIDKLEDLMTKLMPFAEKMMNKEVQYLEKIILQKGNRKLILNSKDLYSISAYGEYCKVTTKDQSTYISNSGITELLDKLDPTLFIRIHRSTAVNIHKVLELIKPDRYYFLLLDNRQEIKVSNTYLDSIKKMLV